MKVLYAAFRHDPRNPDAASGADYNFHRSIVRAGMEVKVVGPFKEPAALFERVVKRFYCRWTGQRYAKYAMSLVWRVSRTLNEMERAWKPDVVFTLFAPSLAFYTGKAPLVYRIDATFSDWQQSYPEFGRAAFRLSKWQQKWALAKCSRVITHSNRTKSILLGEYGVPAERIEVFPNSSALPRNVIPNKLRSTPQLEVPLRLLLVGRDYRRKGVDIAIETVRQLNASGIPADLTVCGVKGEEAPHVRFVGPYRKSVPGQLRKYVGLYRQAHFLLHPARWDPSPIVPAEAAAFGVPTITNDVGGTSVSVKDGVSGVVLPNGSPPNEYAKVIHHFLANPNGYYALCRTARQRYELEQNWDVAGKRVAAILEEAAREK